MQQVRERPPQNYGYNILYFWGGLLLALSFVARILSYPVITSDYTYFLSKWFTALQIAPGLTAFKDPFSDYAPLYLYFIKVLTYLPVYSLYSIKTLSVVFDVVLAFAVYLLVKYLSPIRYSRPALFFIFALTLCIPTVVLNGALWGQSDAIYASGVLLSLYYMLRDKPLPAVLWFSFAICVKVQAVFFLPVLIGYCLRSEKTAGYLVAIPVLFFLSIIPARLGGGSLGDLLLVYAKQSGEYSGLSVSAPNVFGMVANLPLSAATQHYLFLIGLALGALASIWIATTVYYKKLTPRGLVYVTLLSVLLVPYLLPRMHERYFYLADSISLVYALYNPSSWYLPVLVIGASLLSYMPYLSQLPALSFVHINLAIASLMLLLAIGMLALKYYREVVTADAVVS